MEVQSHGLTGSLPMPTAGTCLPEMPSVAESPFKLSPTVHRIVPNLQNRQDLRSSKVHHGCCIRPAHWQGNLDDAVLHMLCEKSAPR